MWTDEGAGGRVWWKATVKLNMRAWPAHLSQPNFTFMYTSHSHISHLYAPPTDTLPCDSLLFKGAPLMRANFVLIVISFEFSWRFVATEIASQTCLWFPLDYDSSSRQNINACCVRFVTCVELVIWYYYLCIKWFNSNRHQLISQRNKLFCYWKRTRCQNIILIVW